MHALASKSLSRDRDLTPRYYYKLSEKASFLERIKNVIRLFFTFLFTQVKPPRILTKKFSLTQKEGIVRNLFMISFQKPSVKFTLFFDSIYEILA